MTFHLEGRYLEARAEGRASEAIKRLITRGAKTASVLGDGEEELEVPVSEFQPATLKVPSCLVVADQGLLHPMIGIIAMTGSPLSVIRKLLFSTSLTHCVRPRFEVGERLNSLCEGTLSLSDCI